MKVLARAAWLCSFAAVDTCSKRKPRSNESRGPAVHRSIAYAEVVVMSIAAPRDGIQVAIRLVPVVKTGIRRAVGVERGRAGAVEPGVGLEDVAGRGPSCPCGGSRRNTRRPT